MSDPKPVPTPQECLNRVAALVGQHGCQCSNFDSFLAWLEDRLALADQVRLARAEEAKLEPGSPGSVSGASEVFDPGVDVYGASREDTRPPGKFAQKMRETQAKSASMAMVLMADDLQRAYGEIARLKQYAKDLENQIRELPTWGKEP